MPEFEMPSCMIKHRYYKWWCKKCRKESERQFRDVCEAWWDRPKPFQTTDHNGYRYDVKHGNVPIDTTGTPCTLVAVSQAEAS